MLEKVFQILGVLGIIICVLAFIIPTNPYEIIKGVNYDYPNWLCIIVGGSVLYFLILYSIYSLADRIYVNIINKNNKVH